MIRRPLIRASALLALVVASGHYPLVALSTTGPRFDAIAALAQAKMKEYGVPGIAQGKIDPQAPLRTYLPDFRVREKTVSRDVKVWHLLTHLGVWEGQVSGPDHGPETLKDFFASATMTDLMQVAPPGAAWSYNVQRFAAGHFVRDGVVALHLRSVGAIRSAAHRGLLESLPSVQPLAPQPDIAPYLGTFLRPSNSVVVRAEGDALFVQERPNSGTPGRAMPVAFYGTDRVVVLDGPERNQSIELVRDANGRVDWVRVVGRVAVRAVAVRAATTGGP